MTHPRSLLVLALTATSLAGALSTAPSASAADGRSPAQTRPLLTSDEELALDVQLEMAAAHRHLVIQQVAARLAAARAAAAQQAALAAEAQRVAQAVAQQAAVQAASDQQAAQAQQAQQAAAQAQQASQAAAQAQQAQQATQAAAQAQQATQAAAQVAPAQQPTQAQQSPSQPMAGQSTGDPKGYARQLLSSRGEAGQFGCLDSLWGRESGWQVSASNASSGAYGIPQALPGSKMASVGPDWQSNAATQIQWGLGYIDGRYGSPCAAWSHSQANGWY